MTKTTRDTAPAPMIRRTIADPMCKRPVWFLGAGNFGPSAGAGTPQAAPPSSEPEKGKRQ